jgi:hypothetical protein
MTPNVTQLEAMAIARALAKEEAELPFAIKTGEDYCFTEAHRDETSVRSSCGCCAEVALVARNIVVVETVRCKHHGDRTYRETYAVLGHEGGGFAHLKPEVLGQYGHELHPPVLRGSSEPVH